jgi:cholesterol oxidase
MNTTTRNTSQQTNATKPVTRRWLSQDLSELIKSQAQAHANSDPNIYDLVIIGSGYGGAMAASQFGNARNAHDKPAKICVLERGKEYLPGAFPSQMAELPNHVRFTTPNAKKIKGFGDGLLDFRIGADVCALVANGLGGGSLINAGVMLEPEWRKAATRLPKTLTADLDRLYSTVKTMLGSETEAITWHPKVRENGPLPKTKALEALQPDLFSYADLTVQMSDASTPAQTQQGNPDLKPCNLCGDCMTGCNIGAKKSLDTNLLMTAYEHGVELFTGASVLRLKRVPVPSDTPPQQNPFLLAN